MSRAFKSEPRFIPVLVCSTDSVLGSINSSSTFSFSALQLSPTSTSSFRRVVVDVVAAVVVDLAGLFLAFSDGRKSEDGSLLF